MKQGLKLLAINYAVLCALLVSVELAGQLVYFVKTGQVLFLEQPRRDAGDTGNLFELHPFLAARPRLGASRQQGGVTITTTAMGTRVTGAPPDDGKLVRIAVLGGSTTFGTGVTDRESWPALLQSRLGAGFAVTNYGVPGYSSAEAIIQMALLVPEKRPHIVVFYQGWNDIRNYHEAGLGPDYYGHGMRQYENLEIPVFRDERPVFATAWIARRIKERLSGPAPGHAKAAAPVAVPDPYVDRIYLRNLRTLKWLTERIGAYGIFVPQVLNEAKFRGHKGSRYWTRHIVDDAMPALLARFNGLMSGLCQAPADRCQVLDEVGRFAWSSVDFVDDGHFSRAGGAKFAGILAERIRAWRPEDAAGPTTGRGVTADGRAALIR